MSTRFDLTHSFIRQQFPQVDVVVFSPTGPDMRYLSGSPMKYRIRMGIVSLAYKNTIRKIFDNYDFFNKIFSRHGISLRKDIVIEEESKIRAKRFNLIKVILETTEAGNLPVSEDTFYSTTPVIMPGEVV
jgi:hypothetical protein